MASPPPSPGSPPTTIDPYEILSVPPSATAEEIKRAYRKAALKHHPDKAAPDQKTQAHSTFQSIAFAYSILLSPRRKARYDATGSTADITNDAGDFNWVDFYRAQFAELISADSIEAFKRGYQGSEEERADLLASYAANEGNMHAVFEQVILSDPLEDEERFRAIIDDAIKAGDVQGYTAYVSESKAERKRRAGKAKREEREARELARELGVEEKLFGGGKKAHAGGGLGALIQQRMKARAEGFLESLEEKYSRIENEEKAKRKSRDGRGGRRKGKGFVDEDADADAVMEEEEIDIVADGTEDDLEEEDEDETTKKQTKKKTRSGRGRRNEKRKRKAPSPDAEIDEEEADDNDDDGLEEPEPEPQQVPKLSTTRQRTEKRDRNPTPGGGGGGGGRKKHHHHHHHHHKRAKKA